MTINYLLFPFFYATYSFIKSFSFFCFCCLMYNVYPKYCANYKKDDNQRIQRLYILKLF